MRGYISGDEAGANITADFSIDESFGELEVLGAFVKMNDIRSNWWEGVGFGGSITGRATQSPDGKVFFGACDKRIYCIDRDGKQVWTFNTEGVVLEGPDVANGLVYAASTDQNVYALNEETGLEVWRFQTNGKIIEKPVYHNGRVYIGGCLDGNFYCLDAVTGKEIWKLHIKAGTVAVPLVHGNRIYTGYDDMNLYCLDMDGNIIWRFQARDVIAAWPASISEDKLFFGSWDCNCYCVDLSGRLVWRFSAPNPVLCPIAYKGRVYVPCWDHNVYCLDENDGNIIWKTDVNGFPGGSIMAGNGMIYIGSTDDNVYALDCDNGDVIWKQNTNGYVAQVTLFGDRIYAGSWDCNMYCIDAGTGEIVWKFQTSMGTPSKITPPERSLTKEIGVIWDESADERKKVAEDVVELSEYGEMKGNYIDTGKSDYAKADRKGKYR